MLEIIIKKDKLPQFGTRGARYYICLDDVRIDDKFFVATGEAQDYKVSPEPGNHKVSVYETSFQEGAAPKDILDYDFEATKDQQVICLKYNKKDKNLYFGESDAAAPTAPAAGESGKSGGGFFGKLFKK